MTDTPVYTSERIRAYSFNGGMDRPPEGWESARITSCESRQRADLANASEFEDEIFYRVRIEHDVEDLELEVQCRGWMYRTRTGKMYIAGLFTRNNHVVPYWAVINTEDRTGYLWVDPANFEKIGFQVKRPELFP